MYMSRDGRMDRKEGMYKLESSSRKKCICLFFCCSAVVFFIFGGIYAFRANNANWINTDFTVNEDIVSPFDSCHISGPGTVVDLSVDIETRNQISLDFAEYCKGSDVCEKYGTRWTAAFNFNAVIINACAINFVLMAIGGYWFYPRLIGTFLNCCYGLCHFAAWGLAVGVYAAPPGRVCTLNIAANQYLGNREWSDDWTFKMDGQALAAMGSL